LVRTIPIVFWFASANYNKVYLKDIIYKNCKLCHPNKICLEAAYIFSLFLYYSMEDYSKDTIFNLVQSETISEYHKNLIELSKTSPYPINKLTNNTTIDTDSNLFCRYYVSLQCVLYNFYNGDDLKSCMENTIKYGGDTSVNGAMIGALAGGFYSLHSIPFKLINTVEKLKNNDLSDLILLSGHKIKIIN
jgi:ADP-ribosylglycohydrolase